MPGNRQALIACIGEAMVELHVSDNRTRVGFAGDTLNTAIYCERTLQRLFAAGHKQQVAYITRLGLDPLSAQLANFMRSEALDLSLVEYDQQRQVGIYSVNNRADGEREFHYWRASSAARLLFASNTQAMLDALSTFDIVYLSGITLAIMQADARDRLLGWFENPSNKTRFAFDSNYRPSLWENTDTARSTIQRAWRCADIALPSVDDEMLLFNESSEQQVLERINDCGCDTGALKRGAAGPLPLGKSPCKELPAMQAATSVVDTTAAGDSFNGAFLATIAANGTKAAALQNGHELARQVVSHHGAIVELT